MRERLQEFPLSLYPDKTRLIEPLCCGQTRKARARQTGDFDFLGFTFIGGKSRRGNFLLTRKTRRDRVRAKLKEVKTELRRRMQMPIPDQGRWLRQGGPAPSPIMP